MARVAVSELTLKTTFDAEAPQRAKVGDVIHSMLTEAQFQAQRDSTWVLMDGRDLSITNPGSAYEALTGQSILPNAKGRFLRGLDTSGTVDPDGVGRIIGDNQSDSTAKNGLNIPQYNSTRTTTLRGTHAHGTRNTNQISTAGGNHTSGTNVSNPQNASSAYNTLPAGTHNHTVGITHSHTLTGDSETRPKNIAVNIFIKINE